MAPITAFILPPRSSAASTGRAVDYKYDRPPPCIWEAPSALRRPQEPHGQLSPGTTGHPKDSANRLVPRGRPQSSRALHQRGRMRIFPRFPQSRYGSDLAEGPRSTSGEQCLGSPQGERPSYGSFAFPRGHRRQGCERPPQNYYEGGARSPPPSVQRLTASYRRNRSEVTRCED